MASIPYQGELAALGTALCWTGSSLAFAAAGRRIGSLALNWIRLVLAFGFLTVFCWIRRGLPLPTDATPHAWRWLALSGLLGFVVGDLCLFRAFVLVGARISTLIMSLVPPMAALAGWLVLGERLALLDGVGMALTLAGILWVVLERQPAEARSHGAVSPRGVALAVLGAVGQAGGLVLSKLGMGSYDPFATAQIRVLTGIAGFSALFVLIRWWGRVLDGVKDRAGMGLASIGALFGPFVGVSLSLVAIQHTQTGVAATIMATTPIFVIPAVVVIHGEKVSTRAVLGALVAVAGVALLWLA